MSEYTKEQEAEALRRVGSRVEVDMAEVTVHPWSQYLVRDIAIVSAMAKRTAEAEREASILAADCSDATCMACPKCCDKLEAERDALKARVAELEAAHQGLADVLKEERRKAAPPPVVVTREMLEMMLADAETRAVYGRGDVPLNPAARLVVALRKMLEAKP